VASTADVEMGIQDGVEVAKEGCGEFVGAVSIRRGAQTQPNSLPPMYRLGRSQVTEELLEDMWRVAYLMLRYDLIAVLLGGRRFPAQNLMKQLSFVISLSSALDFHVKI